MQARATKKGVAEAEAAFDAMAGKLDRRLKQLAFPGVPDPAALQAALDEDEALVLMLDDPYARRVIVAISSTTMAAAVHEPEAPLEAVQQVLKGKARLLVAPDGMLSVDQTRWGKRKAAEAFDIHYLPSASWWLFAHGLEPGGKGLARIGPGPDSLGAPGGARLGLLHIGTASILRLSHARVARAPMHEADTVVFAGVSLRPGRLPTTDALAALAARQLAGGTRQMLISLVGPPPPEFWSAYYSAVIGRGLAPDTALRSTRQAVSKSLPKYSAGVVIWGVP
jgi:hypothetical protein